MTFLNWTMLLGLAAVAVPILIHLLNRRRAKVLDWGAMQFLLASLASRNRRILIEEVVLMVVRCMLVALVVLAMARPFLPTRSALPWTLVLPAVLGCAICAGIAAPMWANRRVRWCLLAAGGALLAGAAAASVVEHYLQGARWSASGEKDVAIVIDGSASMALKVDGRSNFQRAVSDAAAVVRACRPADAISVILAGPVPRMVLATATCDRQAVAGALEDIAPAGGTMAAMDALNAAVASLAEGHNPAKKIVLITDGQSVGWDLGDDARWRFLAAATRNMPTPPQFVFRTLGMPREFSNAAVEEVSFSRKVIGTDRPVGIDVKVTNTGAAPITPGGVELRIDALRIEHKAVGEILPNAAETVRFVYRFDKSGYHVVTAALAGRRAAGGADESPGTRPTRVRGDEMAWDDAADRVVHVVDTLPVLIVDGSPSSRPLDAAAAFLEIALAPADTQPAEQGKDADAPPEKPDNEEDRTGPAGRKMETHSLVEPVVVAAPDIKTVKDFGDYRLIILADVPKLPAETAEAIERFVRAGGGLLIAPGRSVRPEFYNSWTTAGGVSMVPGVLAERKSVAAAPVHLALKTFSHPSMELLVEPTRSDADSALVKAYWRLQADEKDPAVRVSALLETGEPLLIERKVGKGYVLMTAFSLDRRDSNVPTLKCFVPMVHELAYYLAAPMMAETNVKPGSVITVDLPNPKGGRAKAAAEAPDQPLPAEGVHVLGPRGRRRQAAARRLDGALRLSFAGTDEPGLYRFALDDGLRRHYLGADSPSSGVPFVILGEPAESRLGTLTDADFRQAGKYADVRRVATSEELISTVAGGVPGQQMWKPLTLAALLLVLAEIALTRWIATRRRSGQVQTVQFGGEVVDVESYRTKARRMLAVEDKHPQGAER